jgi:signal transduction histidine kinase
MFGHLPVRRRHASLTRYDLVPDLSVAVGTVAVTSMVLWAIVPWLGELMPLLLFVSVAAALTSWRGFGSGVLASSLGTTVGNMLFIQPLALLARRQDHIRADTFLMFGSSMFLCWLIYRHKTEHETTTATHDERNSALQFVAHELRSPLATVQLAASLLERDRSEETRERATKLILGSASRLGRVIDDLVDVARVHTHGLRIETAKLRLEDTLAAALDAAALMFAQKQQCLSTDIAVVPPMWTNGDAGRLQQVFANLLSNASRYSPEGAEIFVSAHRVNDHALIVIRDTGVGIRSDMLERIFVPFVREAGGGADGLGLGLTIVRSLVEQHGGDVRAESAGPGQGSSFIVELPLMTSDEMDPSSDRSDSEAHEPLPA